MSEHRYKQTVCREYSQGVCHDGAAILKDGEPMTIEQILDDLRAGQAARAQQAGIGEAVAWECSGKPGLYDNITRSEAEANHYRGIGRKVRPLVYGDTHPQPAQQGSVPEMNDEVRWILGRPNFACAGIAQYLRSQGREIQKKAEDEQAEAIYWMLSLYSQHGADWRQKASNLLSTPPQEQ